MKKSFFILAGIVVLLGLILALIGSFEESNEQTTTVMVTDKAVKSYDRAPDNYLIYGKNVESGDTVVYEIKNSFTMGRYNSSEVYSQIEVGKTYRFVTRSYRVERLDTYPNIYGVTEVK